MSGLSRHRARRVRLVLVVEDEADIRRLVRAVLEEAGFAVIEAGDARAALDLARRHRPNAVVLDLRLPAMDGAAFARAYRRRPGPHAPLVVLSAEADAGLQARRLGADLVPKPFDLDELVATVRRAAGCRTTAQPARPADGRSRVAGTRCFAKAATR